MTKWPLLEGALRSMPPDAAERGLRPGVCRSCRGDGCETCDLTGTVWVELPYERIMRLAEMLK